MTPLIAVFVVFVGVSFSWWLFFHISNYVLDHQGHVRLEVLVKDTGKYVYGPVYCMKCAVPLQVYALAVGYSATSGEERFRKIGRCDSWRWYRGGGHCKRGQFSSYKRENAFNVVFGNDYVT